MNPLTASTNQPKLVLVDAYALIYRAYHAVPPGLMTSKGESVNAVFGFTAMLLDVLRKERPEYVAMAFDMGRTFRHEEFSDYKGTRVAMPDDLSVQLQRVEQIVNALNIPIYRLENYEADDVIGTLSSQAAKTDVLTLIVTGDTDTLQLVQPNVFVITPGRIRFSDARVYDVDATVERYGFAPPLVADYKALTGDTSDNIPKIPGIGEKTATKLLQQFGPVEQIYAHLDEVQPPRIQQILRDHTAQAKRNKHLTTIVCDVPVTLDLESCRTRDFDRDVVVQLFRELEFRSLVSKIPDVGTPSRPTSLTTGSTNPTQTSNLKPQTSSLSTPDAAVELAAPPMEGASAATPGTPIVASGGGVMNLLRAASDAVRAAAIEAELTPQDNTDYQTITERKALDALAKQLRKLTTPADEASVGGFSFDTESTSQDALAAELVGISIAVAESKSYYIPVAHRLPPDASADATPTASSAHRDERGELAPDQLDADEVQAVLGPIFADPDIPKTAHNAKYDVEVMENAGYTIGGMKYDTQIAAYLLNESSTVLKDLAFTRLGVEMTRIEQLMGMGKNQITFDYVDIARAAPYSAADADMTMRLRELLTPQLYEMELWSLFRDVEMPLVPVLVEMERNGIAIDVDALRELSAQLDVTIKQTEEQIHAMVGHEFNIGSTKQLAKVLYEERGLHGRTRTQSGFSTDKETLEALRELDPVIDLVLEHRTLKKLKSTYLDDLTQQVSPRDGRVHTNFGQTTASSGRLSSSKPNLQNIPIRSDIGRLVRKAFIADNFSAHPLVEQPSTLMSADYSQIELRLLAVMSGEPSMLEAFREGIDIHRATAAEVSGVPLDKVTGEMRRLSKTVNFGLIYGMGTFGLASRTSMSNAEASEFIKRYWARYPRVRSLFDRTLAEARERGYVTTLLGRRRYIPELSSHNQGVRQSGERMAINMPVQGTAADIIKIAMIRLHKALHESGLDAKLLLQVHDELLLELPRAEVEATSKLVRETMEGAMQLDVPLDVEISVGDSWGEMKQ